MQAGAEAMGPHDFESWGLFLWSSTRKEETRWQRSRRSCGTTSRATSSRARRSNGRARRSAAMVDLKFCDLLGTWQHVTLPIGSLRRVGVRRGPRLRRLLDPRLAGDRGERHDPDARRVDGDPRSVHRGADALAALRDRRAGDARAVRQGSAPRREARRGVPALDRHRRHVLTSAPSASSSSSTRSRTRAARTRRATRSTRPRATGTPATPASATRSARSRATSRPRRTTR